jgi:hypothetical protein
LGHLTQPAVLEQIDDTLRCLYHPASPLCCFETYRPGKETIPGIPWDT